MVGKTQGEYYLHTGLQNGLESLGQNYGDHVLQNSNIQWAADQIKDSVEKFKNLDTLDPNLVNGVLKHCKVTGESF